MTSSQSCSVNDFPVLFVLLLEKECIERFGEKYSAMSISDWFKVIVSYMKDKTHKYDLEQDDIVYWNVAEDRTK